MPTEFRFYHLQRTRLDGVLPLLLTRTLAKGWHAVVKAGSDERVDALNQSLWTSDDSSFIPHGSAKDGDADMQPVWLTTKDENPNGAQVLMLVDGTECPDPTQYQLVCNVFDGNDDEALDHARAQWKALKDKGLNLTYWQQTANGWEQKA